MATSSIDKKFEKLRARLETVKCQKRRKVIFFEVSGIVFVRTRKKKKICKQCYKLSGKNQKLSRKIRIRKKRRIC